MVQQEETINSCSLNKGQGRTLKTHCTHFTVMPQSLYSQHAVFKLHCDFLHVSSIAPDKNDAIMSKCNLAEWSLSVQRCYCVIVDVMELFFLGFMAPGRELVLLSECFNASVLLWRLTNKVSL